MLRSLCVVLAFLALVRPVQAQTPSRHLASSALHAAQQGALIPSDAALSVTINGRDAQGELIDPVNVWEDYNDRSQRIVGQIYDGDLVTFIQQQGNSVQIELPNGVRGWVSSDCIKQ